MFKELVIVAASGEKLTAGDWREIPYIPCCPFYIVYHVHVLPILIFLIKQEAELFLLRWKNTKDILSGTKSKLQNSMNSSVWFYFCNYTYMYVCVYIHKHL